jgi:3-keto-disaccharide hydrolase
MNWSLTVGLMVVAVAAVLAADDKPKSFRFDKASLDKLPAGWKGEQTGKGSSVWKVVADDTAPSKTGFVLAQTTADRDALFNLCVAEDTSYQDVEITVAFKAVKGEKDQGGGIVWRYQDADNYYIARMNPLEDNFRVYKVVAGKRTELATKDDVGLDSGKWYTLSITHRGDSITCSLEGKKHLEAKDDTFTKAGKVGLWTKADAQTYFADLRVKGR